MKVIFDTDPGTDDALAIMMALNSPDIEILGVTTVGGNASPANATSNALRLLHYTGRTDIPVARGGPRPLEGVYHPNSFHGRAGLSVNLPRPDVKPIGVPAWDFIISVAASLRGELTMFAVGPLTNVAKALLKQPRVASWIKHLYIMGGAIDCPGNTTPNAEFNIWDDADAAQIVLNSGIPITLVGLDVTNKVLLRREEDWWRRSRSRTGLLAGRVVRNWLRRHPERPGWVAHDPLTVVAALHPEVMTLKRGSVSAETEEGEMQGKTTATYGEGTVDVAVDVDAEAARHRMWDLVVG